MEPIGIDLQKNTSAHFTFLFENRETVRYQVLEMMRIERIVKEADILHELKTYNVLLHGPGSLGCSFLIGIDDETDRDQKLRAWLGLNEYSLSTTELTPRQLQLRRMSYKSTFRLRERALVSTMNLDRLQVGVIRPRSPSAPIRASLKFEYPAGCPALSFLRLGTLELRSSNHSYLKAV